MKEYQNCEIVVGVSGGKDSTAVCLNLIEQGYSPDQFKRVFANTGWEDASTYEYLKQLEEYIGEITFIEEQVEIIEEHKETILMIEEKLGFKSPFVRSVFKNRCFPNGFIKWCTRTLKIQPFIQYFDQLESEPINLVGIRKEESKRRSKMEEWEFNNNFNCWTHRPILNWSFEDIVAIHKRHNLTPNNLYLNGFDRVGCFPCIYSNKSELNKLTEERIEIIKIIEESIGGFMFNPKNGQGIEQIIQWSNTSRGGKQFFLFDSKPPTCEKWGLCGI